jgi:hypothetical protein
VSAGVEANPAKAKELLQLARDGSVSELNEAVARARSEGLDREARRRAIHARRKLARFTDLEGVYHAYLSGNPEDGMTIDRVLTEIRRKLITGRRESELPNEKFETLDYDAMVALFDLACGKSGEMTLTDLLEIGLFPQFDPSCLSARGRSSNPGGEDAPAPGASIPGGRAARAAVPSRAKPPSAAPATPPTPSISPDVPLASAPAQPSSPGALSPSSPITPPASSPVAAPASSPARAASPSALPGSSPVSSATPASSLGAPPAPSPGAPRGAPPGAPPREPADPSGAPDLLSLLDHPDSRESPPSMPEPPPSPPPPSNRSRSKGAARLAGRPVKIIVRIDLDALLRGYPMDGEVCDSPGYGPIPVSLVHDLMASDQARLVTLLTKGEEVRAVHRPRRHPNESQRSALEFLYPLCAVRGCNTRLGLDADHRVDWAKTHYTVLDYLDHLCWHHHQLKTRSGWALVDGHGKRDFVPPNDPRHPNHHHGSEGHDGSLSPDLGPRDDRY